jgi:hypothetical protein
MPAPHLAIDFVNVIGEIAETLMETCEQGECLGPLPNQQVNHRVGFAFTIRVRATIHAVAAPTAMRPAPCPRICPRGAARLCFRRPRAVHPATHLLRSV